MTCPVLLSVFRDHPVISTDSRHITPGCIFFALKGESFNGNIFAKAALNSGAAFAVIDEAPDENDERFILVEDVLGALQQLALFHRKQFDIPVIAITGTNGKTTTKELINAVLSDSFRTTATIGNLNNHIGVPLTILKITEQTEIVIIEMGANHVGEIDQLCRIALPTHGIITNIGKAHLGGFGGFEGVVKAKTELYRFLAGSNGKIFVNADDQLLMDHAKDLKRLTYGTIGHADIIGEDPVADPYLSMNILFPEEKRLETRLFGLYNVPNVLAAACIGNHFGINPDQITASIAGYTPANNRSQVQESGKNRLFLDAYNANPSSMEQAIRNFAALPGGNKIYILGDMLELGDESEKEHSAILSLLAEVDARQVYLVGPDFMNVNRNTAWMNFQDSELARMWFNHHIIKGADVLIKGSRGIRMEKIVDAL